MKLFSSDQFKALAKGGRRPEGAVFRLLSNDPEVADETRTVRFVFSDDTIDLAGDSIKAEGWELDDFNANPVAFFSHASWDPPIGRAANVAVKGRRLIGDIEFASADIYPFADTIYRLVKGGYLRAVSVGFMPLDYEFITNDKDRPYGIDYLRQKLLEISVCGVPCNPNALTEARAKGIDTGPLSEWASKVLDKGGHVLIPRTLLEETFKAAKTPHTVRKQYLGKVADWKVGAGRDLPLDESESWDGAAAEASIFEHAGGDDFDPAKARLGFLVYDAAAPKLRGSYKEPFAHVVDGALKAVKGGIKAADARLSSADISEGARTEAQAVIEHYEKAFGMDEDEADKARRTRAQGESTGSGGGDLVPDDDPEVDPEDNGDTMPSVSCGKSKDEECLFKDAQNCSVHYTPPKKSQKTGRRISAANKALLEAARGHHAKAAESAMAAVEHHKSADECIKQVLDSNTVEEDADGGDGATPDAAADPDKTAPLTREERIARARKLRQELQLEELGSTD